MSVTCKELATRRPVQTPSRHKALDGFDDQGRVIMTECHVGIAKLTHTAGLLPLVRSVQREVEEKLGLIRVVDSVSDVRDELLQNGGDGVLDVSRVGSTVSLTYDK